MDIVLAVFILALIGIIFYREIRNAKQVDLFMDCIPTLIVLLAGFFNFQSNKFKFNAVSDWIYIASIVVAIAYTVYFLVKYFKDKKSTDKDSTNKENEGEN